MIQSSRPSNAESLLYTVTCTVGALLQRNCPEKPVSNDKAPPPAQDPSSSTTSPTSDSQTHPQTTAEPTTGASVPGSPEPLDLDEAMAGEPPLIASTLSPSTSYYQYPARVLFSMNNKGSDTSVLGARASNSPLEATDQGWRFLGLLWYWWVLMIAGVTGLAVLIKTTVTHSFARIVRRL